MPDRSEAGIRNGAHAVGSLQVLSHFGGEFERQSRWLDPRLRATRRSRRGRTRTSTTETSSAAWNEIGYEGYLGYELCHQLPVVDGQTVGIEYADQNAELAAEFMRELIDARGRRAEREMNNDQRAAWLADFGRLP